jgi:general secretion pathway protein E
VGLLTQAMEGVGSALVASTLRGVLVARPIRLLCPACKQPSADGAGGAPGQRSFVPRGCETCGFTGFKGRRVLADAWIMDPDAQWLIRARRGGEVFERIMQAGSRMREQGLALVEDGLTSTEELASIMEESPWRSPTFSS